jgi:hypothetical protein
MNDEMSDAFCRLSTGGSLVVRTLYTDDEETLLQAQRPACFTGITEIVTRADLVDRCLFLSLVEIENRREEKEFWVAFRADWPAMLGAVLDAVSLALKNADQAPETGQLRQADFAAWVNRGEAAFGWAPGTFLRAYEANRLEGALIAIEADSLATAVLQFMRRRALVPTGRAPRSNCLPSSTARSGTARCDPPGGRRRRTCWGSPCRG